MPQMDGIQLIQRLNRLALPEMPEVAVVTGLNEEQLNERGGVPADSPRLHQTIEYRQSH